MKNKKINIGIMGGSSFAEKMMIPSIKSLESQYNLIAIASRSPEKAKKLGGQFGCIGVTGYDELIAREDIDAIYCPLPTGLHFEWGMKTLESGKHLLLEKSLTSNFENAKTLLDKGLELNLCVMENFMFQYHNQQAFVKEKINSGVIGKLRCFRSSFGFPPFPDKENIRYQKKLGGGALLDAGGYTIKAAQMILGNNLKVKGATLSYDNEIGVDIFGSAHLENEEGIPAQLSFGFDNYYQCNYEVWGSKGKIIVNRAFTAKPNFEPEIILETPQERLTLKQPADNQYTKLFEVFYDSINENDYKKYYEYNLNQAKLIHQIFNYAN